MQCACAVLLSVACPALQYFSSLFHTRHDFRKKTLLNTKCVFWFSLQLLSETFLILRRNERDMVKKFYPFFHVKCQLFFWDINETWIYSTDFRQNTQISNFMKILSVGAELFHASRWDLTRRLTLILLTWRIGELLIMPADARWDLTRRLILILLMWKIWWASNNASRCQMGFNSAFNPSPANMENTVSS